MNAEEGGWIPAKLRVEGWEAKATATTPDPPSSRFIRGQYFSLWPPYGCLINAEGME